MPAPLDSGPSIPGSDEVEVSSIVEVAGAGPAALDVVEFAAEDGAELDRVVDAAAEGVGADEDDVVVEDVVAGLAVPGVAVLHPASTHAETMAIKAVGQERAVNFIVVPPVNPRAYREKPDASRFTFRRGNQ